MPGLKAVELIKRIVAAVYYLFDYEHRYIIIVMLLIWLTAFLIFTLNKSKSGIRPDNHLFNYVI